MPGEGPAATEVMFVGEGPGYNEDKQGRPFVGRAGDLLEKLLASVYWKRDEVFIANVVKCRPPDNRDPEADEIAACSPFLARQLEILDPALVVTLGRFSMARFNPGARISQVHGTCRPAHPDSGAPDALAFFMYHPAAALRSPGGELEAQCYADMKSVPQALTDARARRAAMAAQSQAATPAAGAPAADTPAAATPQSAEPAFDESPNALPNAVPQLPSSADPDDPTSQLSLF